MKKLLSLLSVLTISGTAVPTTIAASPYQKEQKLNNDINYLQTNNLENLNRSKRSQKNHLHHLNKFDLKNGDSFLKYLVFCYFYNKYWNQHVGYLNPDDIVFNVGGNSFEQSVKLSDKNFKIISQRKIASRHIFSHTDVLKNPSNIDDDKAATTKYEQKTTTSNSVTTNWNISSALSLNGSLFGVGVDLQISGGYGEEKNNTFSTEKTISLEPFWGVHVPAHKQRSVTRSAWLDKIEYTGVIEAKISNPDISIRCVVLPNSVLGSIWEDKTLNSLVNELKNNYGYGDILFNSNYFLSLKNNELFVNIPTIFISEDNAHTITNLGNPEDIK